MRTGIKSQFSLIMGQMGPVAPAAMKISPYNEENVLMRATSDLIRSSIFQLTITAI